MYRLRNRTSNPPSSQLERVGPYPIKVPNVKWVAYKQGDDLPENLFCLCTIETGEKAFAARAIINHHNKVPGFVLQSTQLAYIPYGCTEHICSELEVMVVANPDVLMWVERENGVLLQKDKPVNGGKNSTFQNYNEVLYIGRTCTPLQDALTFDGHQFQVSEYIDTTGTSRLYNKKYSYSVSTL